MFLVDTHCHLNKEYFPEGLKEVFRNAVSNDVKRLIFASADVSSSVEAVRLSETQMKDPEVWALAGIHPHEASIASKGIPDEICKLAMHPRVVGIGEIGLDYFYDNSSRDLQKEVFRMQIELAKSVKKPIVVHVRDAADRCRGNANEETLRILRETGADEVGGVIHCFSGTAEDAAAACDLGFYISFAGPVTYKKNTDLRRTAADIPSDRILCETDSPYLAPNALRGRRNEPCNVRYVYEILSMLKGLSLDDFADIVMRNGERIFGWAAENV
jgi:TatD DNase family protein